MALTVGQLIADRYRLNRRLAVGGMGEVWEAGDTRLARRVAIKVLKAELSGDGEFLQRFRVEAQTAAGLNHPGIATVHDYGETAAVPDGPADTAYLVMELVEGEPLAAMIARRGRLSPERTIEILEQAGHALQAAHERGFVHRDVKPGNILLAATGAVKLTDFGIAKAVDAAPVTRSGMVMGTAHYIAPEQAMGQEAGPPSDVYSLGVVGYECLTGHRPFLSDSAVTVAMMHIRDAPPPLPPDVPPGVRALIESTLVKDPRARYGTGGEFAAACAAVRAGMPLPRPAGVYAGAGPTATRVMPAAPPTGPHAAGGAVVGGAVGGPPGSGPFPQRPPSGPMSGPMSGPTPHRHGPRLGPWIVVAVFVVAALLIAAWVIAMLGDPDDSGSRSDPTTSRATEAPAAGRGGSDPGGEGSGGGEGGGSGEESPVTPEVVTIDKDDYKDRPVDDVVTELEGLGLVVDAEQEPGGDRDGPCLVDDVDPDGEVTVGDSVTVTCRMVDDG